MLSPKSGKFDKQQTKPIKKPYEFYELESDSPCILKAVVTLTDLVWFVCSYWETLKALSSPASVRYDTDRRATHWTQTKKLLFSPQPPFSSPRETTAGLYIHKYVCEPVKNQKNKHTLPFAITSCLIKDLNWEMVPGKH